MSERVCGPWGRTNGTPRVHRALLRVHRALRPVLCALAVVVSLVWSNAAMAAGVRTVVFPFDLIDDSQEGEVDGVRADQTQRLALITEELNRMLVADGRYQPVDIGPIRDEIKDKAPIYKCNGCEDDLARKAGADLALICTVQKVSNLILNINLFVRNVKTEKIVHEYSVDVRGNTDESWTRSLRYLVKNRLFEEGVRQ